MDQIANPTIREEMLASTGVNIFVRSWTPPAARAVVVLCHGVNSR